MSQLLEGASIRVRVYAHPEQALEEIRARESEFDAVLLDLNAAGTAAGRELLAQKMTLALAGDAGMGEAALAAGAGGYLLATELAPDTLTLALRQLRQHRCDLEALQQAQQCCQELTQSEQRYRLLTQTSAVGMISIDEQARILFANPAAEKIFGYSHAELAGQPLTMLMPPDYKARFRAAFERFLKTGERTLNWERYEAPGWHREQREIRLEIEYMESRDGDGHNFHAVFRDISEQHQALRALSESQRRYANLAETIPVGITISDRRHILHEVNHSFCEMLGFRPEELLGRPFYEFTSPEDIPAHITRHNDVLAGRIASYSLQKRYLAKNGQAIWAETQGRLLRVPDEHAPGGESLYVITTVNDITRQVRLQEKLGRAERLESVGRMAAGLAHDFSNYLMVINTAARQLLDQYRSQNERRTTWREPLEKIIAAGQRAAAMTEQLLAIGRQQPPALEVLDLNLILRRLAPTVESMLNPFGVALRLDLAPGSLWIRTRASQVEQMINNLAINARAAMPRGGRLDISTRELSLPQPLSTLTTELPAGLYAQLSVRDQGEGMDEITLSHIFEPFFTTRAHKGGTGLGLTTVYSLAEQNHAGMTVESRSGQGTQFQIFWPSAPAPSIVALAAERQCIWVVEDEEGMRWLMRSVLELSGYEVLEAASPLAALNLQSKADSPPDLVISDVLLPEMSGPELIQRLRAQWPQLKALLVSAYGPKLMPLETHDLNEFGEPLQKPFTPEALLDRVRLLLE